MRRYAIAHRQTAETDIQATLNLDGTGQHQVETGIGFLDHMLAHVAVHGLFDLAVRASGDLHVIASGGVASLADVRQAYQAGLSGVIIGRALTRARWRWRRPYGWELQWRGWKPGTLGVGDLERSTDTITHGGER